MPVIRLELLENTMRELLFFSAAVGIFVGVIEVAAQQDSVSVSESLSLHTLPHFPLRTVHKLEGGWDFAFLGDIDIEAARHVKVEDFARKQVSVPDAFDGREWLCGEECLDSEARQLGWPCGRCCDLARGVQGDELCWRNATASSFHNCCDAVALARRGVAVYRRLLPPQSFLLRFGACSMRCDIYLDRTHIMSHIGGYSPFQVVLPWHLAANSSSELLVVADNRFLPDRPVHQPYFDWYQYGGLLRPVECHSGLPSSRSSSSPSFGQSNCTAAHKYLHHVEVRTLSLAKGLVQVIVRLSPGVADCGSSFSVHAGFDGGAPTQLLGMTASSSPSSVNSSRSSSLNSPALLTEQIWEVGVPHARTWSPESPSLHTVQVVLRINGLEVDSTIVRFGLRTVEAKGRQVLLNGRPIRLLGVNRHESSPRGGIFMTDNELFRDVELLKELGANFVRGSHYSQDQRFLNLCDEHGLLVWEETLGWQPRLEHLQDQVFAAQQMQALEETIAASCNHPSVIIWGFLNEGESNSELARPLYSMLTERSKALDPTRLVSFASKTKFDDVTLDLADVISFNDYPGWYDSSVDEIPSVWKSYGDFVRSSYPDKPFLISEAGASGLTGFRSKQELAKWSEDLQAVMLLATLTAVEVSDAIGVALWQFADNRVDTRGFFEDNPRKSPFDNISDADWVEHVAIEYATTNSPFSAHPLRPRRMNNKGLLSMDRRYKKQAFFAVQESFLRSSTTACPGSRPLATWVGYPVQLLVVTVSGGADWSGWSLAVHTWNQGDRPPGEPGLRVHAHAWETRATLFCLEKSGQLRIVSHLDQRPTALGWHVSLSPGSLAVTAREAPSTLWQVEPFGDWNDGDSGRQTFRLRSTFGSGCGNYISIRIDSQEDFRDENSLFLTSTADPSLAIVFRAALHQPSWNM